MTRSPAMMAFLFTFVSACGGYQQTLSGSPVWRLFPFDGERTWTYISTDESLPYKLDATSNQAPESRGGMNIYNVVYTSSCFGADPTCVDGGILRKVKWSSDVTNGVFIHAYSVGDGAFVDLEPPVQLGEPSSLRDDVTESSNAAGEWTSTYLGTEQCPIALTGDWDECGKFEVTVDNGDGSPIAGTYWATVGNGLAAMELAGDAGRWELSDLDCTPDEDCDGSW